MAESARTLIERRAEYLERCDGVAGDKCCGLSVESVRCPESMSGYRGLSSADAGVLWVWLESMGFAVEELHTGIPVGPAAEGVLTTSTQWLRHQERVCFAKRIDAAVRRRGRWSIVELKPYADHAGLGQLLYYGLFGPRSAADLRGADLVLVCLRCGDDFREVYEESGVEVIELGDEGEHRLICGLVQ